MTNADQLQVTIEDMVQPGKGILAADESLPTIAKRFTAINLKSTEDHRRAYRQLLFSAPDLEKYISGVIEFDETLSQIDTNGRPLHELLARRGIVPGVKVDKGKSPLALSNNDFMTFGLDGLAERLQRYKSLGMRFAKWRAVYKIGGTFPSAMGIAVNAEMLAIYAAICQEQGIVPIVEPEVLNDGTHDLDQCACVTEAVQAEVFNALHRHHVVFEHLVLKPNMVTHGSSCSKQASPEEIAEATLRVLCRTVPAAVPGINFLSGGMSPETATANLNAMNANLPDAPWLLSFSFGRALQQPVLQRWLGKPENIEPAQEALLKRARLNSLAQKGQYVASMELEN